MKRSSQKINTELVLNDRLLVVVLLATLLVVPLALRFIQIDFVSPLLYDNVILNTGIKVNIFTYLKSVFLIIFGILALLLLLSRMTIDKFEIKSKIIYISLGVAVLGLVFSALMSPFKSLALFGDYARQEGTITNLLYLLMFFVALTVNYTQTRLKWFGFILYPFVILNSTLTMLNFFGYNTLQSTKLQSFLGVANGIKISEGSRLIATLDNINYISGVSAILIGVFLTWSVVEERIKQKMMHFIAAILAMLILLTSTSQSGFVSFLVVFVLIIGLIVYIKNKKQAVLTLLAFLTINTAFYIPLVKYNPSVWSETIGIFNINNPFVQIEHNELNISSTAINNQTHLFNIKLPEPGISAGSGRTYIWQNALDLIKDRPLSGYGMDTFAYKFPQDESNKISGLGSSEIIVDKPHNMYLDFGYGGGLITLLAILVIIVTGVLRTAFGIVRKKINPAEDSAIVAFFFGSIAFFVQGLFNDSIIGVSPIGWILFGVVVSRSIKMSLK